MLDRNQLKAQGVRYARSLQVLFKTIAVFSADHPGTAQPFQQSFDLLNALLKQTGQFTIGFVEQRVMLNNILTTEKTLSGLENEFLKRGIGAVTFQAGMTLAAYKRGVGLLARSPKLIEEAGGLAAYLENQPLEFMRVFPASKSQTRTESGDTILDMDSESYLLAKTLSESRSTATSAIESFEALLRSSAAPSAAGGGGDAAAGSGGGGGAPASPGSGSGAGPAWTGIGGAPPGGAGPAGSGPGGPGGSGGDGPAGGGGGVATTPAPGRSGGPRGIQEMVEGYFQGQLLDPSGAPERSYVELARVLKDMKPDMALAGFPPQRREELRSLPPDQMAAEIIEDSAVKWATERLREAPTGQDAVIVEEEVIRVLLRSLQATKMADRLARKLAQFCQDVAMPQGRVERIQEELRWVTVPEKQKAAELLKLTRFDRGAFRHLLDLIQDLVKQQNFDTATQLGLHYLKLFERQPELEELARFPELFKVLTNVRSTFWPEATTRLCAALDRPNWPEFQHRQVINALVTLCKNLAVYEDFDLIQKIGAALENQATARPEPHARCCGATLEKLLTPSAVQRLIEIYQGKRDDPAVARMVSTLLCWSGGPAITRVFQQLAEEPVASNRLALLRLIPRLGEAALEPARQQVKDQRWFVVRNACKLLSELKDPDLPRQLAPALRHRDERVQKAALAALRHSHLPERTTVLAEALPNLRPQGREEVLRELTFLRDPSVLPALERFLLGEAREDSTGFVEAVQAVVAIGTEQAEALLGRLLSDATLHLGSRRAALSALGRRSTGNSRRLLGEFVAQAAGDPLLDEARKLLASPAN
ncbi:MAG TPA: HEAT repeat domain-containing protein [Terriglobales bacterium]|nr:HEAT repeat domain-containing protein [Terriglobales bacterium]